MSTTALLFSTSAASAAAPPGSPDFGPNVHIFDPSQSVSEINATLAPFTGNGPSNGCTNSTGRNAVYFMPGTYGSAAGENDPATATGIIDHSPGFCESIGGLGDQPGDVTINGNLRSVGGGASTGGGALGTFWRSLSNMRINPIQAGQPAHTMTWLTSQASPLRRIDLTGNLSVGGANSFGSFIANSRIAGQVDSGNTWVTDNPRELGQAHYALRDSTIGSWRGNGVNFVFSGVNGAPPTDFGDTALGEIGDTTTLPRTPISREAPFLYVNKRKKFEVFVPKSKTRVSGHNWSTHHKNGESISIDKFFIAKPADSADTINAALAHGKNLILTPGMYRFDKAIKVTRPNTVVMGMGYATIAPTNATTALEVNAEGVVVSAVMFDNGPAKSDTLIQINKKGRGHSWGHKKRHDRGKRHVKNPTTLNDVFVRGGGTFAGAIGTMLEVNQNNVLIDHTWLWRADHGAPGTTQWAQNPVDTGLQVNGDNVTAIGLFVEHNQKKQVIWKGEGGKTIFFQCEPPYDVPSQAQWMNGSENGYPCYEVVDDVRTHKAIGLISWTLFTQFQVPPAPAIFMHSAYKTPVGPGIKFRNAAAGKIAAFGGIENTFNNDGRFAGPGATPASFAFGLTALRQVRAYPTP